MAAPSSSSYFPWDSNAPAAFKQTQSVDYVQMAFIVLLLYDHVITLDKEIAWIWTLQWRLPKIIFVINRYLLTSLVLLEILPTFTYPSIAFCDFIDGYLLGWVPLLNFAAAELLMIIRVCAIYDHRKLVVWSLCSFWAFALITAIVTQVLADRAFHTFLYYEGLPGCWEWSSLTTNIQWHVWVPSLSIEGILMLLTASKLLSYRNDMNRTITVLARDSIVYFIIIFVGLALTLGSQVRADLQIYALMPTQCISSIAVGRMMMNIRGLILEDPEHTVHLQTLQFGADTHSASEIEEVVV